jgi:two-component system chemotaxis sensor kinase CheA
MIVDVSGQTMVVPISAIVETIRPEPSQLHWIGPTARMITVRDVLIPVIELGSVFGQDPESSLDRDGVLLLVEDDQGEQCALAVDRIFDQRQVVIKSLESNYGHVPYIAAATILGDGQIALIVDLDEITHQRANSASITLQPVGVLV